MTRTNLFRFGISTLAMTMVCVGLVSTTSAADAQRVTRPATAAPLAGIALHEGGVLFGQVIDAQQRPLANHKVRIFAAGRVISTTETNAKGQFGVRGLRGGLHTIEATGNRQTVQLWTPQTAPPAANQVVVIAAGNQVTARAQDGEDPAVRRRRLAALGLGAAGLAWALDYNPSGS